MNYWNQSQPFGFNPQVMNNTFSQPLANQPQFGARGPSSGNFSDARQVGLQQYGPFNQSMGQLPQWGQMSPPQFSGPSQIPNTMQGMNDKVLRSPLDQNTTAPDMRPYSPSGDLQSQTQQIPPQQQIARPPKPQAPQGLMSAPPKMERVSRGIYRNNKGNLIRR